MHKNALKKTQDFPGGAVVKNLPAKQETQVLSLGREGPREKEMATHCSTLAWRIPWTEEPGGLQSMGSQSQTRLSDFTFTFSSSDGEESTCNVGDLGSTPGLGRPSGGRYGNPLQYSCLENPMDAGAWRAAVHRVAKSRTRLKRLSAHAPSVCLSYENFCYN